MELSYHLFMEDMRRLSDILKNTDLIREHNIVETMGRALLSQLDGAQLKESARSTIDESPDIKDCDDCYKPQSPSKQMKPPVYSSMKQALTS